VRDTCECVMRYMCDASRGVYVMRHVIYM